MLATFIIGLREGLEAALIIGIIAAFLRKAGKSLAPMWIGVTLAVILSVTVGVVLKLVERELPQQRQEALATVIGAVAVVFVTGMIVWMNDHAREMKAALEEEAAEALSQGNARSLAVMAFLAVMKEGIETSVFLVATFSVAQSTQLAATGAILGIGTAAIIGYGIYAGGVKINLAKFFRVTGVFLILVAAGLTLSVVRTAHAAGWINAGQQKTIDLTSLVQPGTVQSALITGVLGIPADPRVIEVIAWFAYIIPVSIYVYWPRKWRPQGIAVAKTKFAIAATLVALAIGMFVGYPSPAASKSNSVDLISTGEEAQIGTADLITDSGNLALQVSLDGEQPILIPLTDPATTVDIHNGMQADQWVIQSTGATGDPQTVTLNDLVKLNGGRLPIGIDASLNPGPFEMSESTTSTTTVLVYHGVLMDASQVSKSVVEISGGGLSYPRTLNSSKSASSGWQMSATDRDAQVATVSKLDIREAEHDFWAHDLPIFLGVVAAGFTISGIATVTRLRRAQADALAPPIAHTPSAV